MHVPFVLTGGTLQGFISDVLQKRAPVLALSLLLAVASLVGYSREYSLAITCFHSISGLFPWVSDQPWGDPEAS